ncbi:hypothetical protein [Paenibacillus mesophilus]|uniref:hypothetical protein n=1 Tax=Paenibacillus mesophilus TaxID=2582849 RepID=UPI00192E70ED|nr:hypothetical protein [Paenibacillus mesophilus]
MSLAQVMALQIDERSYSLATVLRSAVIRESFGAINDYISHALITLFAEENGIAAGQEEIQEALESAVAEGENLGVGLAAGGRKYCWSMRTHRVTDPTL